MSTTSVIGALQKAEAQLAYELEAAKVKQKIRNEEIEIDVVERRKQIAVEEKEILRREKELTATIRLPAEAEAYRVEMIAQGKRCAHPLRLALARAFAGCHILASVGGIAFV